MKKILENPERNVAEFLTSSIQTICKFLGITTKFVRSSEIPGNDSYKREYRIYDFCQRLGGDTYIGSHSVIGGSAFVCESVPDNARVGVKDQEIVVRRIGEPEPVWCYQI